MSEPTCPHCGETLYGLVSRCFKCGGSVGVREEAERALEESKKRYLASQRTTKTTMEKLQRFQIVLLANWLIVPALAISIWRWISITKAFAFLVVWLVVDRLWDAVSDRLIVAAGKASGGTDPLRIELTGELPIGMTSMMILDLVVTFALPTAVALLFFVWS